MTGKFLTVAKAAVALGVSKRQFQSRQKYYKCQLDSKHRMMFLIPLQQMVDPGEYQNDKDLVEVPAKYVKILQVRDQQALLGTSDDNLDSSKEQLQVAKLNEILIRTKFTQQKLMQKRRECFHDWTQRFFIQFTKCFGQFKNSLINLRLDRQNIKMLQDSLQVAMQGLESVLNEIKNEVEDEDQDD